MRAGEIINSVPETKLEKYLDGIKDKLPDYYGNNMDALWDCLHCSFEFPTTIVLKNIEKIPSEMREAVEIMLELFRDLEERDEEVTVVVEAETKIINISDYII